MDLLGRGGKAEVKELAGKGKEIREKGERIEKRGQREK